MQAISGPYCYSVICCRIKSVENSLVGNHVKESRRSSSFSCRDSLRVCCSSSNTHGQNLEEKTPPGHCNARRLFITAMSGTALFTCLERNFIALAAGEETSVPLAPEGIIPHVAAAPTPAVSELTASEGATAQEAPSEGNGLIRKLLARSKANKEKNDKARLDDYYKRNYKEYFEYIEGTIRGKKVEELTEAEKGIIDWLEKNK